MSTFRYILVILLVNGEDRILRHCHEKASGDVTSISTQKVFRFLDAFFCNEDISLCNIFNVDAQNWIKSDGQARGGRLKMFLPTFKMVF